MTQETFNRMLEEKRQREGDITSALPSAPDDQIEPLLRDFISCKYFLEPEEMDTNDLIVLGERSTAKMAGLKNAGIEFKEKSAGCTTASSGIIKKVLLAMAVGKLIGAKLDPDAVAETETIGELASLVCRTRGG